MFPDALPGLGGPLPWTEAARALRGTPTLLRLDRQWRACAEGLLSDMLRHGMPGVITREAAPGARIGGTA